MKWTVYERWVIDNNNFPATLDYEVLNLTKISQLKLILDNLLFKY